MGYYIPGPDTGKVNHIIRTHCGRAVTESEARAALDSPTEAPVCVVSNLAFSAAGFCYDEAEFDAFADPNDRRPKVFMVMGRAKAEELSGYRR